MSLIYRAAQFALTALYHFYICVIPFTPRADFLLAIMETIYVVTGKTIYRDMTRFWGKLFGINFALGVATGPTMEFQFGTNWSSFYSNYVGDIFWRTTGDGSINGLLPRIHLCHCSSSAGNG